MRGKFRLPVGAGKPGLFRTWRGQWLPIQRAIDHLAHALKPPLRAIDPALAL